MFLNCTNATVVNKNGTFRCAMPDVNLSQVLQGPASAPLSLYSSYGEAHVQGPSRAQLYADATRENRTHGKRVSFSFRLISNFANDEFYFDNP